VVVPEVAGQFLFGPQDASLYRSRILGPLEAILGLKGYFPRPAQSPLKELWDRSAPYRITATVDEQRVGRFMSSPMNLFEVELRLVFEHGGSKLWDTVLRGRTRQPPPKMPARLAGILAVARERNPELERLLYVDAIDLIAEALAGRTNGMPVWEPREVVSPGTR
jgi:hypothetical protein